MIRQSIGAGIIITLLQGLLPSASSQAFAQTNDEINARFQFNFLRPGARSLALGSTAVSLDFDATFAFTNPAGLWKAHGPGVSVEYRRSSLETDYPDQGFFGDPSILLPAEREPLEIQYPAGLQPLTLTNPAEDSRGPAFLSVVYPRGKWSFALYRHELADYRASIRRSEGAFLARPDRGDFVLDRLAPVDGDLDLQITSFGLSTSLQLPITSGLWFGLGIAYNTFDYRATTSRFRSLEDGPRRPGGPTLPPQLGPADFSPENEFERHLQVGDDDATTINVGLVWENLRRTVNVAAAFRAGPRFSFDYEFLYQAKAVELDRAPEARAALSTGRTEFKVPDVFSLGVAVRATPLWTLTIQYDFVTYSDLAPRANILLNGTKCTDGTFVRCRPPDRWVLNEERLAEFVVDDANELHVGVERRIPGRVIVDLRLGAWFDPDHQMRYEGAAPERFRARFAPGSDEIHVTGGLGVELWARSLTFDAGFDVSDRANILSFSSSYNF